MLRNELRAAIDDVRRTIEDSGLGTLFAGVGAPAISVPERLAGIEEAFRKPGWVDSFKLRAIEVHGNVSHRLGVIEGGLAVAGLVWNAVGLEPFRNADLWQALHSPSPMVVAVCERLIISARVAVTQFGAMLSRQGDFQPASVDGLASDSQEYLEVQVGGESLPVPAQDLGSFLESAASIYRSVALSDTEPLLVSAADSGSPVAITFKGAGPAIRAFQDLLSRFTKAGIATAEAEAVVHNSLAVATINDMEASGKLSAEQASERREALQCALKSLSSTRLLRRDRPDPAPSWGSLRSRGELPGPLDSAPSG